MLEKTTNISTIFGVENAEKKAFIVIVNYNGCNDTIDCLESLRAVKNSNICVVVVDNGSSDDSAQRLREFLKRDNEYLICLKDNLGFSGGNNAGIRFAINKGAAYICLLNNDTVVEPSFLEYMLEKANDTSVVFGTIKFFDEPQKIWFAGGSYNRWTGKTVHFGYGKESIEDNEKPMRYSFVTGCLLLIPVSVIKKVGLLPEHYFLYYEDTEYSLRLIENCIEMKYAEKAIIYHKISSSTQKMPERTLYYSIRNSLLVISEHEHNVRKVVAYLFVTLRNIKRVVTGKYRSETVMIAYRDFMKRRFGKFEGL